MTTILIVVVLAVLLLLGLLGFVRWRNGIRRGDQISQQELTPVDLPAFRNLMDPEEEQFLRQRLKGRDFRVVQRWRLYAALEYVRAVGRNAAVWVSMGESAARSADPAVADAGRRLVETGLQLRLHAPLAMFKLCLKIILPNVEISAEQFAERYQSLCVAAGHVVMLQNPMRAPRLDLLL
jgi:hypothetical protein